MRHLFLLFTFLGILGIVLGVLNAINGAAGTHGVPFRYENYGGPGSVIAGVVLVAVSLYLRFTWRESK